MPDPYIHNLLDQERPCKGKTVVTGKLNCILHARAEKRGLELCPFPSRAVLKNEIHELILTAEDAGPGKTVNKIAYLGYFEVDEGGVLWVGDEVELNGKKIGILAGYDLTHFPNHMNIIIRAEEPLLTGFESSYLTRTVIRFMFCER